MTMEFILKKHCSILVVRMFIVLPESNLVAIKFSNQVFFGVGGRFNFFSWV